MRQTITATILLFILAACSAPTNKSSDIQNAPLKKDTTALKAQTSKLDTLQIVDSLVNDIKLKIKDNLLTKKTENQMDPEGGWVYGYFNQDKTIEYLYSSYGGEFGKDEIKTYYKDGKLIYSEYRFFWFDRDKDGEQANERLVAEKLFYLPESSIAKDTLTVFNDKLKHQYLTMMKKSEIPTAKQIVTMTLKMQTNLKKHGE